MTCRTRCRGMTPARPIRKEAKSIRSASSGTGRCRREVRRGVVIGIACSDRWHTHCECVAIQALRKVIGSSLTGN
jgi:hypothetical protein